MRSLSRLLFAAACLFCLPHLASAHEIKAGDLDIQHPWTRATAQGAPNGAGFMVIVNKAHEADKLIAVSTPVAASAELHTHIQEGEVMRMRPVDGIDVPAMGQAVLKPGSFHIMLMGLKEPLVKDTKIPMTLTFQKAGKIEITMFVSSAGAIEMDHDTMGHNMPNHDMSKMQH